MFETRTDTTQYIMYHSPWYNDTSYFWRDYPVTDYDKLFKYYYLVQYAFWLQQIFVLQIEAPRKDYRELVLHHINTLLLIFFSYGCNFTRVGNAVFVYMDLPDAFLAVSVVCVRRKGLQVDHVLMFISSWPNFSTILSLALCATLRSLSCWYHGCTRVCICMAASFGLLSPNLIFMFPNSNWIH